MSTEVKLLRYAAALMRERASAATDGPWWADDSEQSWRLHGVGFRLPPPWEGAPEQIVNKQILKAPKASEQFEPYWPDAADAAHMVPMLNPAVALTVAAWLDESAGHLERHIPGWTRPSSGVDDPPAGCWNNPERLVEVIEHHYGRALSVARAYLGVSA